jgi:hypothetical protein
MEKVNCPYCNKQISKTNISKYRKICKRRPDVQHQQVAIQNETRAVDLTFIEKKILNHIIVYIVRNGYLIQNGIIIQKQKERKMIN